MTIMCFIRWNYDNLNMKKKKNYILLFLSYRNTAQHNVLYRQYLRQMPVAFDFRFSLYGGECEWKQHNSIIPFLTSPRHSNERFSSYVYEERNTQDKTLLVCFVSIRYSCLVKHTVKRNEIRMKFDHKRYGGQDTTPVKYTFLNSIIQNINRGEEK